jgi:F-box/WD-40 domain protein MET30
MVEGTVAPFLARHIPEQYAPLGSQTSPSGLMEKDYSNTRYCYRHHPDLKCRRRADEPSMDQLQKVCRQALDWKTVCSFHGTKKATAAM